MMSKPSDSSDGGVQVWRQPIDADTVDSGGVKEPTVDDGHREDIPEHLKKGIAKDSCLSWFRVEV